MLIINELKQILINTKTVLKNSFEFLRAYFSNNANIDAQALLNDIWAIKQQWVDFVEEYPLDKDKITNLKIKQFYNTWNTIKQDDELELFVFINQFFVALPYLMLSYTTNNQEVKKVHWIIGHHTFKIFKQWDQLENFCQENIRNKITSKLFINTDNHEKILNRIQRVYNHYFLVNLSTNERKIALRSYFLNHHWWVFIVSAIILGLIILIIVVSTLHKE
ncbi:hypothetical protein OF377_00080 [Ureaplasma sp. ES3154-GEN]|uniref:hypothetical protein n=1 Tax=Ureaplasma sp. ES3154-GEN TaxID=2984844 RepID=UPI0021E7B444|nr:hypothetical protein [Ureaplasma sp. ES3154-GEN]MCV3743285.1 hypothetical protein [Ureaplasma sp. ES3154-GEN]